MEEEAEAVSRSPQDDGGHGGHDNYDQDEQSYGLPPQKRQKNSNDGVIVVAHSDQFVLNVLEYIETSTLDEVELSLKLQEVCNMLTQDVVVVYLKNSGC
jgi:hypothetical protein